MIDSRVLGLGFDGEIRKLYLSGRHELCFSKLHVYVTTDPVDKLDEVIWEPTHEFLLIGARVTEFEDDGHLISMKLVDEEGYQYKVIGLRVKCDHRKTETSKQGVSPGEARTLFVLSAALLFVVLVWAYILWFT